jgi:hypothetical protein
MQKTNKNDVFGHFAECIGHNSITLGKVPFWESGKQALPSIQAKTLGKLGTLPSVHAKTLDKPDGFAECPDQETRQTWYFT